MEVIQESMMDRHLSKEDFNMVIRDICAYVNSDNRNFITTTEIDSNKNWNNSQSLRKYAKEYYRTTLSSILLKYLENR